MMTDAPRAASSDPTDPRHQAWAMAGHPRINVWLDGEMQSDVSTYDMDEGFVVRAVLTKDGRVQVDSNAPDQIWVERVEGEVTAACGVQVGSLIG